MQVLERLQQGDWVAFAMKRELEKLRRVVMPGFFTLVC
jgi:hypothetical protein